jgi:hypothetical protein
MASLDPDPDKESNAETVSENEAEGEVQRMKLASLVLNICSSIYGSDLTHIFCFDVSQGGDRRHILLDCLVSCIHHTSSSGLVCIGTRFIKAFLSIDHFIRYLGDVCPKIKSGKVWSQGLRPTSSHRTPQMNHL